MRRVLLSSLALAALATPAAAQMQHHGSAAVGAIRPLYEQVRGFLTRAADMVPEADYAFKPTPEVRSFGQLVGHVANAQYLFCSSVLGEQSPNSTNFETVTAKAELVKALADAFAYCDRAYQVNDQKAMEPITFFGQQNNRLWVLNFNAVHNMEHYGNIVTYMRLKGMVPPSSMRGGP